MDNLNQPWVNVAKGPSHAAKGASLSFVALLLKDGKKAIAERGQREKWEAAMVFYVVGSTPTITAVKH